MIVDNMYLTALTAGVEDDVLVPNVDFIREGYKPEGFYGENTKEGIRLMVFTYQDIIYSVIQYLGIEKSNKIIEVTKHIEEKTVEEKTDKLRRILIDFDIIKENTLITMEEAVKISGKSSKTLRRYDKKGYLKNSIVRTPGNHRRFYRYQFINDLENIKQNRIGCYSGTSIRKDTKNIFEHIF